MYVSKYIQAELRFDTLVVDDEFEGVVTCCYLLLASFSSVVRTLISGWLTCRDLCSIYG